MTKILVTGATGFIGHHVVQWLVDHEYTVIATGTSEEKVKQFAWFRSVTFLPCDYYTERKTSMNFLENRIFLSISHGKDCRII